MICPNCGTRWAQYPISHWRPGHADQKEPFMVAVHPDAQKLFNEQFDSDIKVYCRDCVCR